MSRPTKERLEKLRQIPDDEYYKRVHPKPWLGEAVRDLFAEIDALTAEREEHNKWIVGQGVLFGEMRSALEAERAAHEKWERQANNWMELTLEANRRLDAATKELEAIKAERALAEAEKPAARSGDA